MTDMQSCWFLPDLEELYKLSDSILVMYDGEISAYIKDPKTVSEIELGHYMLGVNIHNGRRNWEGLS